ncbi:MAG TPA: hypothetical protein VFZ65_16045 [Planctomycetota bacterium]|nr:hypothetical protein [Planctomycetota bacterium]
MTNHPSVRAVVASLLALTASLSAQSTPSPWSSPQSQLSAPLSLALSAICTPVHSQPDADGPAYGIWAAGANYKVSFHDGMTFVPYVGKGATSHTLQWRTTSARVGELELVTATAPHFGSSQWRGEYDLGGIVEAYDVHAQGLEQSFVLRERPAAAGDLVIRGAITTDLSAMPPHGDGAVRFVDARGASFVAYGAATAIDAAGRRCAVSTAIVAGGLELRLSGDWLAHAAFPLVVDPLLAPTTVATGGEVTAVEITYDGGGTSGNVWYAEVRVSGTDHDLRLFRVDNDGQNPALVFSDLSNSWSSVEPSLGRNLPAQKVLLAYTREILATNTKRVRLHLHARADLAFSATVFDVPSPAGNNHWRPAVGSEQSPISFTSLLVVYQVEGTGTFATSSTSAIHGTVVLCGAGGATSTQFPIAAAALTDHERPAIGNVYDGPTRSWTVAYQRYYAGAFGQEWDVALRRISPTNAVSSEFVIDNGVVDRHEMAPHFSGTDDHLMLFYTASTVAESSMKPTGVNGHRIRGTVLDWNGSSFVAPWGSNDLQVNNDARLEIAGVACDWHAGDHWALAFRSNVTDTVYVRTYGYHGTQLTSEVVETPSTGLGTTVSGGVVFQTQDDQFLIAYGLDEPGVGSYSRLSRWHYSSLIPPSNGGASCTTTQIDWFGSQRIGTHDCGVVFTNAPANSFTVCAVTTAPAVLQLFGIGGVHNGCWLLVPLSGPDHLGLLGPLATTAAQFLLPLPEYLSNFTLFAQAITFDGATGEFYSSNRLSVPIGL